jgi:ubiquinol-cytochrome c reductase cytochrome b subunit
MLLLVPLSFGFTYMMIKLAKNAEANAKLKPKKPSGKSSINLPQRWIYIIFIALLAFQVYLNISAYYAVVSGMKNLSLFIIGIILLVFAGMFHIYRHGRTMAKAPPPPPKPAIPPTTAKPSPLPPKPVTAPSTTERPLSPPPVQKTTGAQSASQTSQSRPSSRSSSSTGETKATNTQNVSSTIKDGNA